VERHGRPAPRPDLRCTSTQDVVADTIAVGVDIAVFER
jgi:uncharacterized protein (DUF2062 family)